MLLSHPDSKIIHYSLLYTGSIMEIKFTASIARAMTIQFTNRVFDWVGNSYKLVSASISTNCPSCWLRIGRYCSSL